MSGAGRLEIELGPMSSGKTTELVRKLGSYVDLDDSFTALYINHASDDRDVNGDGIVTSHHSQFTKLSDRIVAKKIGRLSEISPEEIVKYDLIGIDEIQFFPDLVATVVEWVDVYHRNIVCVGLDGTFERKPWKNVMNLLPYADSFKKKNAICKQCVLDSKHKGDLVKAPFTFCNTPSMNSSVPLIGGLDIYTPLCRKHYVEANTLNN
jgi:thymidine kinase